MLIPNSGASSEEEAYLYQKTLTINSSYAYCAFPPEILDFSPEPGLTIAYQSAKPNNNILKTPSGFVANNRDNFVFHQSSRDFKEVGNSTYKFGVPNNRARPLTLLTLPKNKKGQL